jgi:hypothetical protein
MAGSVHPLSTLVARGFQVEFHSHAEAIMRFDFADALAELEGALHGLTIPIEEIVGSGGGEAKGTQRLRRALAGIGWNKAVFEIRKTINGREREAISHQIDHVREFPDGKVVALEIEWNNKDPFFDRDLENFKRLHAETAISVGVVVTRGTSLQNEMRGMLRRFVDDHSIENFESLEPFGYVPTRKQRDAIMRRVSREKKPLTFREAFTEKFVSDKFGTATTHWDKLQDRVARGVGNPCPLLLIGLPASIITFHETRAALEEMAAHYRDEVEQEESSLFSG